jgi:hypothetical protein
MKRAKRAARGSPCQGVTQAHLGLVRRQVDHAVADDQVGGARVDASRVQRLDAALQEAQRVRRQAEPLRICGRMPLRNLPRARTDEIGMASQFLVCE